jgi:hypothetical protein
MRDCWVRLTTDELTALAAGRVPARLRARAGRLAEPLDARLQRNAERPDSSSAGERRRRQEQGARDPRHERPHER